jgi:hypothetical protein
VGDCPLPGVFSFLSGLKSLGRRSEKTPSFLDSYFVECSCFDLCFTFVEMLSGIMNVCYSATQVQSFGCFGARLPFFSMFFLSFVDVMFAMGACIFALALFHDLSYTIDCNTVMPSNLFQMISSFDMLSNVTLLVFQFCVALFFILVANHFTMAGQETSHNSWKSNLLVSQEAGFKVNTRMATSFFVKRATLLIFFAFFMQPAMGAPCIHCKDSIEGCEGGDKCPTVCEAAANAAIFTEKRLGSALQITHSLPPFLQQLFPRAVQELCVAVCSAPLASATVDLTSEPYTTGRAVVQAAFYGHCTYEDASLELARRMEAAEAAVDIQRLVAAVDMLKSKTESLINGAHGIYTFIWSKLGSLFEKSATLRLGAPSSKSSDLVTSVRKAKTLDEFYMMLQYFVLVISSFGIIAMPLVVSFVADVAFKTMSELKETWQVAQELVLIYFSAIELDPMRKLNLGNVFRNGGRDTYLQQARAAVTFFRPLGGNPNGVKYNGKFNDKAKTPCHSFNLGKEHPATSLNPDGSCKHNHRCNQWVSDKGPAGMCWAEHPRCNCTYDASKRVSTPAK